MKSVLSAFPPTNPDQSRLTVYSTNDKPVEHDLFYSLNSWLGLALKSWYLLLNFDIQNCQHDMK